MSQHSDLSDNAAAARRLEQEPRVSEGVVAIDPTTLALAFNEFYGDARNTAEITPEAKPLFDQLETYWDSVEGLHDVTVDSQPESGRQALNELAEEHGFDAPFTKPFVDTPEYKEEGILAIVDKKLRWPKGLAESGRLYLLKHHKEVEAVEFSAYPDEERPISVFEGAGFRGVARVAADPEQSKGVQNYLWAIELSDDSEAGDLELAEKVRNIMSGVASGELRDVLQEDPQPVSPSYGQYGGGYGRQSLSPAKMKATVIMPRLDDIKYRKEWTELAGLTTVGSSGEFKEVVKVVQDVRVSLDEKGAEAAAMTSEKMALFAGGSFEEEYYLSLGDRGPVLVWFTEGDSHVPICITKTDHRSWTEEQYE